MNNMDKFPSPEDFKKLDLKKLKHGTKVAIEFAEKNTIENLLLEIIDISEGWRPIVRVLKSTINGLEVGAELLVMREGIVTEGEEMIM